MDKETLIKEQEKDCCGKYCCCHCPVCFPENNIVDLVASAVIADLEELYIESSIKPSSWKHYKKRWGVK